MSRQPRRAAERSPSPEAVIGLASIVSLKCGGPRMIVEAIVADGIVCVWHTEGGGLSSFKFAATSLEIAE